MSGADNIFNLSLGAFAGWWAARNGPWLRGLLSRSKPQVTPTPATTTSLAVKLHALDSAYGQFAQDASHFNELSEHPDFVAAIGLLADPAVPLDRVLDYGFGGNWRLACVAFSALKLRSDAAQGARRVADRFAQFSLWVMAYALPALATAKADIPASAPLIGFQDWWTNENRLHPVWAEYFTALGTDANAEVEQRLRDLPAGTQENIKTFLTRCRNPLADRIRANFGGHSAPSQPTESKILRELGRFWEKDDKDRIVLQPEVWAEGLAAAERELTRSPPRSLLVSGETLVGKTSFLRLLAERMRARGWRVFEASGADLQAGQIYIGQLEARIRSMLDELVLGRKIIWYIPDILQLAQSGTHSGQSATMLDQILPAVAGGQVLIWSEASPKATTRLLQLQPALRRCLEVVRIEPMAVEDTTELAKQLADNLASNRSFKAEANLSRTAVDAARHYLGATSLPGSALAILRMTVQRTQTARGGTLAAREVLETLAQLTGLPMAILDGNERLDLASIEGFFSARVIGQPEAVDSVVARIAMLKSGLNDPGRPIGVLMFAGPTGTGKTELAKAVADYLFGSVERMVRLDMSEYQTPDTAAKILGGGNLPRDADTLTSRIRKQPFSVVLLDEFEKASSFIWDLFLQVFDDGRLTDANGDTVDFRHCLIILTTNLGATTNRSSGLGFAPVRTPFSSEQIERAMAQTFRPEFQNRLDKVIVFKPLTRELMRGILKKELARIFDRRGLKERTWAVEWESSALEFLLEKGFSPDMGARPLKRAIDQYVIAPMAATIVEKRFPEGDQFVFFRRDGDGLSAEFVDPDGGGNQGDGVRPLTAGESGEAPTLSAMIRSPTGEVSEVAALTAIERAIAERLDAPEWSEAKRRLAARMNETDFWSRPERFETLGRLELMDRLEVAAEAATSMRGRLARATDRTGRGGRELISRLALQLHLLRAGLGDLDQQAPDDAVILVEPAFEGIAEDKPAAEAWRDEIIAMYVAWAKRRHMKFDEVEGIAGVKGPVLIVSGFGAYRTMTKETGLHVLDGGDAASNSGRRTVRVVVVALPLSSPTKGERPQALALALAKAPRSSEVERRYRRAPAPLVRSGDGAWRSGKLDDVLAGDFDLLAHESA